MKKTFLLAAVLIWSATLFAQDYNITFKVNMNEVAEPFTTPEVNGSFNGWCGGCAPMTDDNNDGIWKTTITLPAGTYEYKFAYDTWTGQESLTPGSSCTITTGEFTNRKLTVTQDEILDIVCWGACLDCGEVAPTRNITFKVDMTPVLGSFTTPEVNGTFNGWCGGCNPMTDANGDNVWEVTIAIPDGKL
jgi:1,4-alpha-glucan branching enzyme